MIINSERASAHICVALENRRAQFSAPAAASGSGCEGNFMQKGAAVHFILVSYRRLDNPSGSIRGLEPSNLRNTPKCHYDMWRGTHTQVVKFTFIT
jgi:hypothetical protein